jgi:hypothetical protein
MSKSDAQTIRTTFRLLLKRDKQQRSHIGMDINEMSEIRRS